MPGSSIIRGFSLCGVALVALALPGAGAMAGSDAQDAPSVYEQDYSGPPILRRIPGIRILFGDQKQPKDDPPAKKSKNFDDSYYEPEPAPAKKPQPARATATAPAATDPALPQKTATAAPAKPLAEGPLSCEKATALVGGFGFSSVEATSCSGKLYAFNAKRDGRSFAIKLNPVSGELTEVKKLP